MEFNEVSCHQMEKQIIKIVLHKKSTGGRDYPEGERSKKKRECVGQHCAKLRLRGIENQ